MFKIGMYKIDHSWQLTWSNFALFGSGAANTKCTDLIHPLHKCFSQRFIVEETLPHLNKGASTNIKRN